MRDRRAAGRYRIVRQPLVIYQQDAGSDYHPVYFTAFRLNRGVAYQGGVPGVGAQFSGMGSNTSDGAVELGTRRGCYTQDLPRVDQQAKPPAPGAITVLRIHIHGVRGPLQVHVRIRRGSSGQLDSYARQLGCTRPRR